MSTSALKAAAKGEVPADKARNPYEQLRHQLENSRGEFAKLVGSVANADKFIRVVLNSVLANTRLMDVSRSSLIAACMKAAQDGLMPDGREAVLNIYSTKIKGRGSEPDRWEDKAQYLPMVGGLIKKLYSGGEITYVDATVVHKGDEFKYRRGDNPGIDHEPKGGTDAEVIAAYAIVKLKNGETKREVMWRADIERVRAASKSADTGPWKTWWSEMAIKSVLKRIYKQLPHADAFEEIEKYDNEAMGYTGLESAATVAERALQGQPQALEHQPGEVLEPTVQERADAVAAHGQQVQGELDAARGTGRALGEEETFTRADMERQQGDLIPGADIKHAGTSQEEQLPEGVTPPSEQEQATAVEVRMRAAKTKDALLVAYDSGRRIKDKALRLRLDELFEALDGALGGE